MRAFQFKYNSFISFSFVKFHLISFCFDSIQFNSIQFNLISIQFDLIPFGLQVKNTCVCNCPLNVAIFFIHQYPYQQWRLFLRFSKAFFSICLLFCHNDFILHVIFGAVVRMKLFNQLLHVRTNPLNSVTFSSKY